MLFIRDRVLVPIFIRLPLQWRHNEYNDVSNHRRPDCLLNRLIHVAGLCRGYSLVTDEFPTQKVSDAENVSIWLRHHGEP